MKKVYKMKKHSKLFSTASCISYKNHGINFDLLYFVNKTVPCCKLFAFFSFISKCTSIGLKLCVKKQNMQTIVIIKGLPSLTNI